MRCRSLTSITIPNGITEIDAFDECSNLTSITIPDSVTNLGGFSYCTSLTNITIPSSVTEIDDYTFYGCKSLKTIKFDGTVEQWNSVEKGEKWNDDVPATVVVCSDGEVSIG